MGSGEERLLVGVDVGSREVRAGLLSERGRLLATATRPLNVSSPLHHYFQQSSAQIWAATTQAIREVVKGVPASQIKGIGCDATCSLVVQAGGKPVSICPKGIAEEDVIMWMDHRAGEEAHLISATGHHLLSYLGGRVSLEMQLPKLLWLKKHLSQQYAAADAFFDLPDYLTWRLTGSLCRSQCSLVCKWMYDGTPTETRGWCKDLLESVGLGDLALDNFAKIGTEVSEVGRKVGGLSCEAAAELGLEAGTPVSASLIDAHAGALAVLSAQLPPNINIPLSSRLCVILGTSSCHLMVSEEERRVDGVWGPYFGAVMPGLWLAEGGQSAAGALLDHLVASHPARQYLPHHRPSLHLHQVLQRLATSRPIDFLTTDLHIYPDFMGNRSPLADPTLRGMMCGLQIDDSVEDLAVKYLAAVQALSYGTRHIVERLEEGGHSVGVAVVCGGLSKNELVVRSLSSVLGRPVVVPQVQECMLLGCGVLAASAAALHHSLREAATAMATPVHVLTPDLTLTRYHEKKYKVYKMMLEHQKSYQGVMSET